MKGMTGWAIAGIVFVGIGGAMAMTNPGPEAYDAYATQKLTQYVTESVCPKTPELLGIDLGEECGQLLAQNQDQIQTLISSNTARQNYGVLSIYHTKLSPERVLPVGLLQWLPEGTLPSYEFETVSVLGQHYTFRAERL